MLRTISSLSLATVLAAGCAVDQPGGSEPDADQPGDTDPGDDTVVDPRGPTFQVLLTDAPGDFDEVWVDISAVEVKAGDDWLTLADQTQSFDLLTLQDGVTAALGAADLQPGHYGQLRLIVDSAFVVAGGESEDLTIASGTQTGIKMNLDLDVADGMQYGVVVDFDAHESIKQTGHGWHMTPVVRVADVVGTPIPEPTEDDPADEEGGDDAGDGGDSGDSGDSGGEPVE